MLLCPLSPLHPERTPTPTLPHPPQPCRSVTSSCATTGLRGHVSANSRSGRCARERGEEGEYMSTSYILGKVCSPDAMLEKGEAEGDMSVGLNPWRLRAGGEGVGARQVAPGRGGSHSLHVATYAPLPPSLLLPSSTPLHPSTHAPGARGGTLCLSGHRLHCGRAGSRHRCGGGKWA